MKVSCICPNCKQDIVINGIKLEIDSRPNDVKSKIKNAIGLTNSDKTTGSITIPSTPKDEGMELGKLLDNAIKKSCVKAPPPPEPPSVVEKPVKDPPPVSFASQSTTNPPTPTGSFNLPLIPFSVTSVPSISLVQPTDKSPVKPTAPPKVVDTADKEDNKLTQATADELVKLGNDLKPDIQMIAESLVKQANESKKKGLCLICNKNQGDKDNLICDSCLDSYIADKAKEQQNKQERVSTLW